MLCIVKRLIISAVIPELPGAIAQHWKGFAMIIGPVVRVIVMVSGTAGPATVARAVNIGRMVPGAIP